MANNNLKIELPVQSADDFLGDLKGGTLDKLPLKIAQYPALSYLPIAPMSVGMQGGSTAGPRMASNSLPVSPTSIPSGKAISALPSLPPIEEIGQQNAIQELNPDPRTALDKIGHGLKEGAKWAGIVAGSEFAPRIMPFIPGTPQNNMLRERQAEQQGLTQAEEQQRQAEAGEDTARAGEETAEGEARKTQAEGDLYKAEHPAKTSPREGTLEQQAYDALIAKGTDPVEALREVQKQTGNKPLGKFDPIATELGGEPNDENYKGVKYPTVTAAQQAYARDYLDEQLKTDKAIASARQMQRSGLGTYAMVRMLDLAYKDDPRLLKMLPDILKQAGIQLPAGTDFSGAPPGQPRDIGGNPIGLGQPEAPTSAVRARGQMAQDVITNIPRIEGMVSNLQKAGKLGPIAGRWNDFIAGKVGANDPDYSRLRDELETLSSAFSRLHLNTEQGLRPFFNMMNAGKMSPDNIRQALNTVEDWAKSYRYTGSGNQPELNPVGNAGASGSVTATGPNGHKITLKGGKWVDTKTGKAIQ